MLVRLLEHAWRTNWGFSASRSKGWGARIFLAGRRARWLGEVVRSMLGGWMKGVVREFESIAGVDRRGRRGRPRGSAEGNDNKRDKAGSHPTSYPFLKRVLADEDRGKVILASDSSLARGFSREALVKLVANERNLVVLAERSGGGLGWAGSLWQQRKERISDSVGEEKAVAG